MPGDSAAEYSARNARRITSVGENIFVMSNGQTNPNRPVTMMKNLYSCIDENNDSVNRSWMVFHHGMVAKLTSAAEFSAAEDLSLLD